MYVDKMLFRDASVTTSLPFPLSARGGRDDNEKYSYKLVHKDIIYLYPPGIKTHITTFVLIYFIF